MNTAPRRRSQPLPPWLLSFLGIAFIFSLIVFRSSGYKNAVVWVAFLALLRHLALHRRKLNTGGMTWPILAYVGCCIASACFSVDRTLSFRSLPKLLEWVAGYLVLVHVLSDERRLERAVSWFVLAMGLVAIFDAVRFACGAFSCGQDALLERWFESVAGYPTIAASAYAVAAVLALTCLLGARRWSARLPYIGALLCFLVLLVLLQSRSALLGLILGAGTAAALSPVARRWKIVMLSAVAAMIVVAVFIPGQFRARMLSGSFSDRTAIWSDARLIFRETAPVGSVRAWLGYGYGHRIFQRLHGTIPRRFRHAERVYDHAHNMLLETRIQCGYLGLAALIVLLGAATSRAARCFPPRESTARRRSAAGLVGALVSLLVYGQFSLFFAQLPILFFWSLLAGLMAACPRGTKFLETVQ